MSGLYVYLTSIPLRKKIVTVQNVVLSDIGYNTYDINVVGQSYVSYFFYDVLYFHRMIC